MGIDTIAGFVDALRQVRLLEPTQQDEIDAQLQSRFTDPRDLARELVKRGWLTPFQINQIMQGKAQELVLGIYRIQARLGSGGMGDVFKARHSVLDKIVALKVIRKEHLEKPDAVRRFRREIRAASSMSHPNIVMAFDADQVGDTYFYSMEYIDGTDLSRLVKESGPIAIPQAIDFMRQAALGLQHAFERDLVHRDIKPANLLLARQDPSGGPHGTVKILDMGLARATGISDLNSISWRTQEGKVLGTPDYIAPEQALRSSEADIRADLYSLGCTFFFILTGKVPFAGGTLMEKLLKHKMDQPPAVESLRPEIPKAVGDIIRKLLAKKPEARYQTPAELAAALDGLGGLPRPPASSPKLTAGSSGVLRAKTPSPVSTPSADGTKRNSAVRLGDAPAQANNSADGSSVVRRSSARTAPRPAARPATTVSETTVILITVTGLLAILVIVLIVLAI